MTSSVYAAGSVLCCSVCCVEQAEEVPNLLELVGFELNSSFNLNVSSHIAQWLYRPYRSARILLHLAGPGRTTVRGHRYPVAYSPRPGKDQDSIDAWSDISRHITITSSTLATPRYNCDKYVDNKPRIAHHSRTTRMTCLITIRPQCTQSVTIAMIVSCFGSSLREALRLRPCSYG